MKLLLGNILKSEILFFFIIQIPQLLFSQKDSTNIVIKKIDISGQHYLSKNKIIEVSQLTKGELFTVKNLEDAINRILIQYQKEDFYQAGIDSVNLSVEQNDNAELRFNLNEGERLEIDNIFLNTNNFADEAEISSFIDLRGQQNIPYKIEFIINRIIRYLENSGYPFCKVEIDRINLKQQNKLDTYISVVPGPFITIDKISIIGNKETRDNVIIRECRIKPGQTYNEKEISKIPQRLSRLGFFRQVEKPNITINDEGKGELIVKVIEGNMNKIDGVVGYTPKTVNTKGFFTGLIDIGMANLLGTGRRFEAYWEKKDLKSQQLRLRYQEPWVFGKPVHMGGWFQQNIQDTSFIKREWMLDVNFPFSENIIFSSNFGREQISPDSIGAILWNIPKSKSWLVNVGVIYDTRDDRINPTQGVLYQSFMEFARKKVDQFLETTEKSSFNRRKMTVDVEFVVPTFQWQVVSIALHGRQLKTNEKSVSISDMFRFGGSKSLRGYREDVFYGSKLAWFNAEYRYLLSLRSRIFIFFDGGYYSHQIQANDAEENSKFSYGFGIRLETKLGQIGVDYGIGQHQGLGSGFLHVRLISDF